MKISIFYFRIPAFSVRFYQIDIIVLVLYYRLTFQVLIKGISKMDGAAIFLFQVFY
jgi:hypothetical protein